MDLTEAQAEGHIDGFEEGRQGGRFVASVSKGAKTGTGTGDSPADAAAAAMDDLKSGGKTDKQLAKEADTPPA